MAAEFDLSSEMIRLITKQATEKLAEVPAAEKDALFEAMQTSLSENKIHWDRTALLQKVKDKEISTAFFDAMDAFNGLPEGHQRAMLNNLKPPVIEEKITPALNKTVEGAFVSGTEASHQASADAAPLSSSAPAGPVSSSSPPEMKPNVLPDSARHTEASHINSGTAAEAGKTAEQLEKGFVALIKRNPKTAVAAGAALLAGGYAVHVHNKKDTPTEPQK